MQLGMLARFCCRVAGYPKVTFHAHTHTQSRQPHSAASSGTPICSTRLRSSTQSRVNAFGAGPVHLKHHSCSASYNGLYSSLWPSIRAKSPQSSPGKTADHRRFIPPWSSIFAILLSVPGGACLFECSFLAHLARAIVWAAELLVFCLSDRMFIPETYPHPCAAIASKTLSRHSL
jgi:hypothetical protein